MEMNIDGFLSNSKRDLDDTLRKLKSIFTDNRIEFTDDVDGDDQEDASIVLRWVRGLHGDTKFLVDTIKHNLKLWEEKEAKLKAALKALAEETVRSGDHESEAYKQAKILMEGK